MTKFNSGLLLAGTAALAFAGTAHAQVVPGLLDGTYANFGLQVEGPGAPLPPPVLTPEQAAAAAAAASANGDFNNLAGQAAQGNLGNYINNAAALAAMQQLAAGDPAAVAAALQGQTDAQAALTTVTQQLQSAVTAQGTAQANLLAAQQALTAAQNAQVPNPTLVAQAQQAVNNATSIANAAGAKVGVLTGAQGAAQGNVLAAQTVYNNAVTAQNTNNFNVLQQQQLVQGNVLALTTDPNFASALLTLNATLGTNFTNDAAGIQALSAYLNPAPATYASNGVDRANGILAAADAVRGANGAATHISMAAGALTGSEEALNAGAHFETEVLGALTDNAKAIKDETSQRLIAEEALRKDIGNLRTDLTTETNSRIAADNELRDRIASSTATAIAMGGAAILPDVNFTLSGNVGFYQGATAIAVNAAARVAPNVYITGAVGGGLNKHGELGGRVGFLFGF